MPPLEEAERLKCKEIYELAGCTVVNFSQRQRSMQTRGIADLAIFDDRTGTWWWHEVKRLQGPEYRKTSHPQTADQVWFQALVERFGQEYVLGARDAALGKLRRMGRIE
jgi:hypothetical protein